MNGAILLDEWITNLEHTCSPADMVITYYQYIIYENDCWSLKYKHLYDYIEFLARHNDTLQWRTFLFLLLSKIITVVDPYNSSAEAFFSFLFLGNCLFKILCPS